MTCKKCKRPMLSCQVDGNASWFCYLCQSTVPSVASFGGTTMEPLEKPEVSPAGQQEAIASKLAPAGRSKFGSKWTEVDGILFQSAKEADRYRELKLLEFSGQITALVLQPSYPLIVNGVKVGKYIADFSYIRNGKVVVEDVKSNPTKTAVYRLKKRMFEVLYGELAEA